MRFNHTSILATLLVATLLPAQVFAAKGGKPPPIQQPNHVMWVDANGVIIGDAQNDVSMSGARVYFEANGKLYLWET